MIQFPNGITFDFIASSGSRGFAGGDEGHGLANLIKLPFKMVGLLDLPMPVVAKTITHFPRPGNLRPFTPWRCVWPVSSSPYRLPDGLVNHVGLTNPGLAAWIRDYYPRASRRSFPVFASIAPDDIIEATAMTSVLASECPKLAGLELNLSCPNSGDRRSLAKAIRFTESVLASRGSFPLIIKVAWQDDYRSICHELDGKVDAIHLINTVPWSLLHASPSPLARYDLLGGVSGTSISHHAREALFEARRILQHTPIISGGGVLDHREAGIRWRMGADAISLGSIFLLRPWRVRSILRKCVLEEAFARR